MKREPGVLQDLRLRAGPDHKVEAERVQEMCL